jgi:hypothetical protein
VKTYFQQQAETNGDPPPEALDRIVKIVQKLIESNEDNLAIPLSFCGRVANALIWEEGHWELIREHIQVGTFIRLRNVDIRRWQSGHFRCKSSSLMVHTFLLVYHLSDVGNASPCAALMVHSKTWLTPIPSQSFEVRQLLKAHNHRVLRQEYNPKSGILPRSSSDYNSKDPPPNGKEETNVVRLIEFVDQAELGMFTGLVTLKMVPENLTPVQLMDNLERRTGAKVPVVMVIKDESTAIVALASEIVCRKLYRLLSDNPTNEQTWNSISNANQTYSVVVRSVDWNRKRYFVLGDLFTVESGS